MYQRPPKNLELKRRILKMFGSQQNFAHVTGLSGGLVSQTVNGWRKPVDLELERWLEFLDTDESIFEVAA